MCEYCCNVTADILDTKSFNVSILSPNILFVEYTGHYEGDRITVTINFCPMCGRNLKEDTSNGDTGQT